MYEDTMPLSLDSVYLSNSLAAAIELDEQLGCAGLLRCDGIRFIGCLEFTIKPLIHRPWSVYLYAHDQTPHLHRTP